MNIFELGGNKRGGSAGAAEMGDAAAVSPVDRRSVLKRAAALGLALPTIGGVVSTAAVPATSAQEGDASHAQTDAHAQDMADHNPPIGKVRPFQAYDPWLPAAQAGPKDVAIVTKDATLFVAKDVPYAAWTFDGTIPGRALRAVEGDTINFTLEVDPKATTGHSIDFHSAKTPPDKNYRTIMPGEKLNFSFPAKYPGVFMYHCGTPPALMHIGAGMYGVMVVDPKEGRSHAQELVLVQSDFYLKDGGDGVMVADYTKMMGNGAMDFCVFNGYANQYVENPIDVEVKAPIRMFVLNAGPNAWSSFHVVGTVFDKAYVNGNPHNELVGLQSIAIAPGDGVVV
ncbi:MAG TPA: multicopper oxidase domain-containing protein, partial [Thermomicrobiales bacterium]|nr:multicopper oxidase domain-containing protein [Thermomicrobiales bacterium]